MPASHEVIDLCSSPECPNSVKKDPCDVQVTAPTASASTPTTQTVDDPTGLLSELNNAQRRAVTASSATVAILAGPGSGKTHTLTSRVAWLINMEGYQPQNVIVTTFTVKAAREMKERIGKALGEGREKRLVLGTFHSVARRYLVSYGRHIGVPPNFGIVDDHDSRAIVERIIKRLNMKSLVDKTAARNWISKKKSRGPVGDAREAMKNMKRARFGKTQDDDNTKRLETIYTEYQSHLDGLSLLDYDDLLVKCTTLLRAHPRCVANVQAVLVDEFQDTNGIQFELMRLLAQAHNRITIVGDPDQSIYGWRSAEVTNLGRFLEQYPGTAEVALEENYRSSQSILTTSLAVIQQDKNRYDKSLLAIHKKGVLPALRRLRDTRTEARWIVTEIQRAIKLSGHMLNYNDVAILVRSAALTRTIEQALGREGVPYRMVGGHKFFDRAEVKLLIDYLRTINHPHNNHVMLRIINEPKRNVGAKTCQCMLEMAETAKISVWVLLCDHLRGFRSISKLQKNAEYKIREGLVGLIRDLQRRIARSAWAAFDPAAGETLEAAKAEILKNEDTIEDSDTKEGILEQENAIGNDAGAPRPLPPLTLVGLIETLIERLDYRQYIFQTYAEENESRWANVQELLALAAEFEREGLVDELPDVEGEEQNEENSPLGQFLANIALSADVDKKSKKVLTPAEARKQEMEARQRVQQGLSAEEEEKPMVAISTIHAAKGLEWPVVFIPAAYDGMLPHSRTEDTDEERRLLYVAMTRAKCLLNISYSLSDPFAKDTYNSNDDGKCKEVSSFLEPIASMCFAETGPSYNRSLLNEMGDILGRPVPSDESIFAGLPPGAALEDDQIPIDPYEKRWSLDREDSDNTSSPWQSRQQQQQQQTKRRKVLDMPVYATGNGTGGAPKPWQRGYATTMEGAATSFTVASSFPGFTTASSHQKALEEAASAKAAEERALAAKTGDKGARRAPPGQPTIQQNFLGKVSTAVSTVLPPLPAPASTAVQRPVDAWRQQEAHKGIPPELTKRKPGIVRTNSLVGKSSDSAIAAAPATTRYAHFSSSPPRPDPEPEQSEPAKAPIPPQRPLLPGKENRFGARRPLAGKRPWAPIAQVPGAASGAAPRPATSLHSTTYAQVSSGGSSIYRKRPAPDQGGRPALGVCKPFKPPRRV